jgi:uncharacterized membrane protein YccF (DUF307 family)
MTLQASSPVPPASTVQRGERSIVVRALWFIFIGWWLGQLAIFAAWFWNLLVVTLPLGLFILNRLPQIITLRPATMNLEGTVLKDQQQRPLVLRALYFVLVGWWFSFAWLEAAYIAAASVVLLPIAFWMFAKSAAVTTLRRT